jgi:protein SCO1/2
MRFHLAIVVAVLQGLLCPAHGQGQQPAPPASVTSKSGAGSVAPASFDRFPNVVLYTQENTAVHFYDDLVKGKVVLINFFYTHCRERCPRSTANLAKLQEEFGDELGREVVMLSITVDTQNDDPEVLKRYASMFRARPGWYFLTGKQDDVDQLRRKLGVFDFDGDKSKHTGVLIYGNDALGTWTATYAMLKPGFLARNVKRLMVVKQGAAAD